VEDLEEVERRMQRLAVVFLFLLHVLHADDSVSFNYL
jgi:hypothetical protein